MRQLPAHAPAPSAKAAAIANWRRGTNFNRAHAFDYPYREVPVVNPAGGPGLRRVDGYHPNYVIVSRKMTQLAEVKEETALRYLRELRDKYPGGRPIANVPSSGPLAGTRLIGRQILEVPIQEKPVPQRVVQEAANLGIIIRDVDGKEYR